MAANNSNGGTLHEEIQRLRRQEEKEKRSQPIRFGAEKTTTFNQDGQFSVNAYRTAVNDFLQTSRETPGMDLASASKAYERNRIQASRLISASRNVEQYLKDNQIGLVKELGMDGFESLKREISDGVSAMKYSLDNFRDRNNLQWYDKYRGKGHEEVESLLHGMEDGEEKEWLTKNRYEVYRSAPDFDKKAAAGLLAFTEKQQRKRDEEEDQGWIREVGKWLGMSSDSTLPVSNASQVANDLRKDTTYREPGVNWTDDQRNMYGYLYGIDPNAAYAYGASASENIRKTENEEKRAAIAQWATKNKVNASLGTVAAIAMMPLSLADTMLALTEYSARGTVSTQAAPTPGQISETITGAIGQDLNNKYGTISEGIPVVGGRGWGDAYQLGTSIANSLLSAYTQGTVGTDVIFFGSAASSTMHDAKDRGATDEQAIKLGLLAGLAEAAGEHFSVENLLKQPMNGFFKNILMQSGIEASEEGFTTLMNNFAEQLVMQDDKYLTNIAEVTGIDIVLYKSEVGHDGKYQGSTEGSFKWNENTIYLDINAGLESYKDAESLAKYTMMRTFDHEFTHFIEKWNPEEYNSFRSIVFEAMTQNGENVEDLIDTMVAKSGGSLSYEQASREVIAEAMTDILPESSFLETLARKNQNVFQQLIAKFKEFIQNLKDHFAAMGTSTREANAGCSVRL